MVGVRKGGLAFVAVNMRLSEKLEFGGRYDRLRVAVLGALCSKLGCWG